MNKLRMRTEVKEGDKWDLSLLYINDQSWENDFKKSAKEIAEIESMSKAFSLKKDVLSCLDYYFSLRLKIQKLHSYAQRKLDEDVANAKSNIRINRINDLATAFNENTVFITLELSKKKESFLKNVLKDADFRDYVFFIKRIIKAKKHLLSEGEEKILAKLMETKDHPYNLFSKINDSDFKFADILVNGKKHAVNQANFSILLQNKNRQVRKDAMVSIFHPYKEFRETLSQNLFQHIKNNVVISNIRKHESAIGEFSFEDDLKPAVYENLFKETEKSLPLLQHYCSLRKRALSYKKLYWHDLYVPLVKDADFKMDYDTAVSTVLSSLSILGDEYIKASRKALIDERWVDRYPNKGKRSGAYSSFGYDTPAFILMNYNGTLNSVSTLAHELGHSMHTYLASANNKYCNFDYPIFLAEIASTFNEQALADYLSKKGDKKAKQYIIGQELEKIRQTFFRQTMFAEFEKKLYDQVQRGEMLTADYLESEYLALNRKYYGNSVEIDPLVASEWARIPHFFYNFYVYKYATGLAISTYFFDKVKNGGKKEVENYLKLLKAGGSDFPAKLLQTSGLNIYEPAYLQALMKRFESLLNEFEKVI